MSAPPGKKERETAANIEKMIEPVLARLGFELVLLQYQRDRGGHVLRLFVDKLDGGGVQLDDCASVSREVGTLLEVEDPLAERYHLEVSSPGLNRPLVKERDFVKYTGQKVKVQTHEAVDGRKSFTGTLTGMDGADVVIEIDKKTFRVPLAAIAKANIEYQF